MEFNGISRKQKIKFWVYVYVSMIPPNASWKHPWYRQMHHKCSIAPKKKLRFSDCVLWYTKSKNIMNTHNCRDWSDHNPHWTAEKPLHSPRTTVWAAIWHGGVIGPIFFDTNVIVIFICTCSRQIFGRLSQHYQIKTKSFSCKMELPRTGLELWEIG